jgi:hypothetical protein
MDWVLPTHEVLSTVALGSDGDSVRPNALRTVAHPPSMIALRWRKIAAHLKRDA